MNFRAAPENHEKRSAVQESQGRAAAGRRGTHMLYSTLCYLERGDEYLMLHRVKKDHDVNQGKWIGVGGKFQDRESPEDCVLRECFEETGLTLTDYRYRGLVTFVSDQAPTEYMHLFTASGPERPTPATRGSFNGSRRRTSCLCPCGRGTRSSSASWRRTHPFSPSSSAMKGTSWPGRR